MQGSFVLSSRFLVLLFLFFFLFFVFRIEAFDGLDVVRLAELVILAICAEHLHWLWLLLIGFSLVATIMTHRPLSHELVVMVFHLIIVFVHHLVLIIITDNFLFVFFLFNLFLVIALIFSLLILNTILLNLSLIRRNHVVVTDQRQVLRVDYLKFFIVNHCYCGAD